MILLSEYLLGWGNTGHRIIGKVAEDNLTEKTKKEITKLIGHHDISLLTVWADEIRSDPNWKHARNWHYATIPDDEDYETGKHRGDVIEKVKEFTKMLIDNSATNVEKQNALKFLVHFIGDIHQPLHVGNGKDYGANNVKVKWFNEPTNLHKIWDEKLIDYQNLSYTEYARFLLIDADNSRVQKWKKDDLVTYAQEARDYRKQCYEYESDNLGYEYTYLTKSLLNLRLLQGGIRLAGALNWIFK